MVLWGLQYDPHIERYNILAKTFEQRTGAQVTVQPQEWPIDAKVMAAMAAGSPPDVICWMGFVSEPVIRQKAIVPLEDEVFSPLGIDINKWWRPTAIGAYTYENHYYGVPVEDEWDGYNVCGRIDMIENASTEAKALWPGSKGEEAYGFESYEDLYALAEALQQKDDNNNVKVWGLNSQGWEAWSLLGIMRSLDTSWFDANSKQFNMNSDAAVEGIRLLVETPIQKGIEGALGTSMINAFVAGQVSLARGNATTAGEAWKVGIQGENVIVPPPVKSKPALFMGSGGWGFEMPAKVANKDVATEFLRFMSTYEAQYIFSQIYGGSPPATWALMDSDIYKGDHPVKRGLRRQLKALDNCVFWGFGAGPAPQNIIAEQMGTVREGKATAQEAAAKMQEALTADLQKWMSENQ
jgi:ABC-type glycerol-3-phosphate transport system substrate-binding protein